MVSAWLAAANAGSPVIPSGAGFPILWATLPLVGAILAAAIIIAAIKRWRRQDNEPAGNSSSDRLSEFRSLYEAGELSEEEFARIRGRLTGQLKRDFKIPPKTEGESASAPGGNDESNPGPDTNIRPGPPGAV
jgi:hypothetical protein